MFKLLTMIRYLKYGKLIKNWWMCIVILINWIHNVWSSYFYNVMIASHLNFILLYFLKVFPYMYKMMCIMSILGEITDSSLGCQLFLKETKNCFLVILEILIDCNWSRNWKCWLKLEDLRNYPEVLFENWTKLLMEFENHLKSPNEHWLNS